jgi:hypothetical protein
MRKKIFIGISAVAVGTIAAVNANYALQGNKNLSALALANVEALAQESSGDSPYCHSGGIGSTSCSISAGVNILGNGTTTGCSVACSGGYYACCSLRCTCIKNS